MTIPTIRCTDVSQRSLPGCPTPLSLFMRWQAFGNSRCTSDRTVSLLNVTWSMTTPATCTLWRSNSGEQGNFNQIPHHPLHAVGEIINLEFYTNGKLRKNTILNTLKATSKWSGEGFRPLETFGAFVWARLKAIILF